MAITVAIVLGLLALAFVLYPLYRRSASSAPTSTPEKKSLFGDAEITPLDEREQAARASLQEVELDYQLGNIAESDYRTLRERYMRHALAALKSRYENEQEIDQEIEEQLIKMKEHKERNEKNNIL